MELVLYVILISIFIVGSILLDKKQNIEYKEFSIYNAYLVIELCLIPVISFFFGLSYFAFSIYVLYFYFVYIKYLSKKYESTISDEKLLTKTIFTFYVKYILYAILISIVLSIFAGLKVIGFFFLFVLACLISVFIKSMFKIKVEETYKLMTNDQINNTLGPSFDINTMFHNVYNTYMNIQKNLMNNTIDHVSTFLEPNLLDEYKKRQSENISKKQREVIEEDSYISGGLIEYVKTGNIDTFKIELVFNAKKYVASIETGNVLSGTGNHLKKYTYVINTNLENGIYKIYSEKLFKEE